MKDRFTNGLILLYINNTNEYLVTLTLKKSPETSNTKTIYQ